MNIIVGAVIIAITGLAVLWLAGKICMHRYEIIDKQDKGFGPDDKLPPERTYVTRCVKCGKICTKKVRLR
jgi:hypothetical protein